MNSLQSAVDCILKLCVIYVQLFYINLYSHNTLSSLHHVYLLKYVILPFKLLFPLP